MLVLEIYSASPPAMASFLSESSSVISSSARANISWKTESRTL